VTSPMRLSSLNILFGVDGVNLVRELTPPGGDTAQFGSSASRTYVGVYLLFADGNSYESIVRPLAAEESTTSVTVATSWQATLSSADNSAGPYIYATISAAKSTASTASFTAAAGTLAHTFVSRSFSLVACEILHPPYPN